MESREKSIILADDIVMESLREISMSLSGRDRMTFVSTATEAIASPSQQSVILNKLFKEFQKVESIDFGRISDSKGDLAKYYYYDQLCSCIDLVNELTEGNPSPNITTLNKLHKILLDGRNDFVFGYKVNNFIVINTYRLMVMSLYEMINICVIDCTEYLRAKLSMHLATPTVKKTTVVTKTANNFIKSYEKGQWALIMKSFRKEATQPIMEGLFMDVSINTNNDDCFKGTTPIGAAKTLFDQLPDTLKKPLSLVAKSFGVILALIGILASLRKLIYFYFCSRSNISNKLKSNAEILKATIAIEDSNDTAIEKQKKMLNICQKYSDIFDYNITKAEKEAEKKIKAVDRSEFTPAEISKIDGFDFEM